MHSPAPAHVIQKPGSKVDVITLQPHDSWSGLLQGHERLLHTKIEAGTWAQKATELWPPYSIKHLTLHCPLIRNLKHVMCPHEWALDLKAAAEQQDIMASLHG